VAAAELDQTPLRQALRDRGLRDVDLTADALRLHRELRPEHRDRQDARRGRGKDGGQPSSLHMRLLA
jgi:hypothetical protein